MGDEYHEEEAPNFYTKIMEKPTVARCTWMPMGAICCLILAIIGISTFGVGMNGVDEALQELNVDVGEYLGIVVMVTYVSIISPVIAMLYGLREKLRLANKCTRCCSHCECSCFGCLGYCFCWACNNWLVKPLIGLIIVSLFLVPLLAIFILNFLYYSFWSVELACKGTSDVVESLFEKIPGFVPVDDITGSVQDEINRYCEVMEDGREGGYDAVAGLFILVLSQLFALGYWVKYTTLGGVKSKEYVAEAEAAVDGKSSSVI